MASKSSKTKTLSNLAYSRSLSPTYFAMYGATHTSLDDVTPIEVRVVMSRGEKGNAGLDEKEYGQPNLQAVGTATLGAGQDTLVLKGAIKLIRNFDMPNNCSCPVFEENSKKLIEDVIAKGGLRKIAERFAINLASGQWAARNCSEAAARTIAVKYGEGAERKILIFENLALHRNARVRFDVNSYPEHKEQLEKLTELFVQGLTSESGHASLLDVEGYFLMGPQACVYPSEGRASDTMKVQAVREYGGTGQSRYLAYILTDDGRKQAVMRDAKVGNPLRMIDTWHGDDTLAIATEPYGSNSHKGVAYRGTPKTNFYAYVSRVQSGDMLNDDEQMYFVSMLMRGGVFGGKAKEDGPKTEAPQTEEA